MEKGTPLMSEIEKRNILSEVALGNAPPDTIIANGTVFNVFTREYIKKQAIWIKDERIAYVGPDHEPSHGKTTVTINAEGMVLLPGLIDGHVLPSGDRLGIEEFIKDVIRSGVTTLIIEMAGCATVAGNDNVEYVPKGLEGQPIRFYYHSPSSFGSGSVEEAYTPVNNEPPALLRKPRCLTVGVCKGSIFIEGRQGERVKDKPMTEDELLEGLRLGDRVILREGSIRKDLEGVRGIFRKKIDFRRLTLGTDGDGYLDASLRRALKLGVPPKLLYQMVTLNVAERFHIDHLIGSLSPGRMADILIIPSPDDFSPRWVMCDGEIIYRGGKSLVEPRNILSR
jgi:adenine deaminase